jgi:Methane oxygenase PmoA
MVRIFFLLLIPVSIRAQQNVTIPSSTSARFDIPIYIHLAKPSDHNYGLYNSNSGKTYPVQWFADSAVFILSDSLPAGQSIQLSLIRSRQKTKPVQFKKSQRSVTVIRKDKPVLVYNIAEILPPADSPSYYKRSGFIHPVYTPKGKIVTDAFPSNHAHQHALFHAWTHTTFKGRHVDFWNQHKKEGTVGNAKLISTKEGPVYSEMVTKQEYISLAHGVILSEYWTIRIYNTQEQQIFDISVRQENITNDTLHLLKYIYGGMAFRGSAHWDRFNKKEFEANWSVLTSEGLKDSLANNSVAKWVTVSGPVEGVMSSSTVIGHPSNFRYPQTIRVHPEMPYWVFSPVIDQGFSIGPGATYTARYRYLITDIPPSKASIQAVSDAW